MTSNALPTARGIAWLAGFAGLAGPLAGGRLMAAPASPPPACVTVSLSEPPWIDESWRAAIDDLRAHIAQLAPAECPTVTLSLAREGGKIVLRASAVDGRVAAREVREPTALTPIALGLLVTIPSEPAPKPPSTARVADPSDVPPRDAPPVVTRRADERPPMQIALGAAGGARLGEPTGVAMADVEARVDVVARGWVIVASARFGLFGGRPVGVHIDGYSYSEYAFGLGLGRRVETSVGALDLVLMPTIVLMDEEGGPSGTAGDTASGSDSYLRVGSSLRWSFARAGRWGFGVTLDADLAPSSIRSAPRLSVPLPPLPTWTSGLRLGAAGDLL